jgi:DNA-binding PadR family transcriptional regulator
MTSPSRFQPTTLGYAILGMLGRKSTSGYRIRKLFEETPLGHYSSSPGTIYPALKRLEQSGLVRRSAVTEPLRKPRRVYELTGPGHECLTAWLLAIPDRMDVVHNLPEHLLRFSLMADSVSPDHVIRYLDRFHDATASYVRHLRGVLGKLSEAIPRNNRFALENGIAVYTAHTRWAASVRSRLLSQTSNTV